MIIIESEDQKKNREERVMYLRQSKWDVDVITSLLMDINIGNSSINESIARAKADSIIRLMELRKSMKDGVTNETTNMGPQAQSLDVKDNNKS